MSEDDVIPKKHCSVPNKHRIAYSLFIVLVLCLCSVIGYLVGSRSNTDKLISSLGTSSALSENGNNGATNIVLKEAEDDDGNTCDSSKLKQSFPNIDYAFLGYNIIKGYPDATGHDPGFTVPIFNAEYSTEHQSADCRYSIPRGFVAIADVSCVTSYSSTVIQTSHELMKYLSHSATVSADFMIGLEFSASFEYQSLTSTFTSSESVLIMSTANCRYYYVKLKEHDLPQFSPDFIDWAKKLDGSCKEEIYYEFFDYFGTHYPTGAIFGAKYTYENEMKKSNYEKLKEENIDVAVAASYSFGFFTAKGNYNVNSSQKENVAKFQEQVTTRTISVGAPPPENGEAMSWASVVKDNPIPIEYTLSFIANLFTEKYMSSLGVNYEKIRARLEINYRNYCGHLQNRGEIDNCDATYTGIEFASTRLHEHTRTVSSLTLTQCLSACVNHVACEIISYCTECNKGEIDYQICYMFSERDNSSSWSSFDMKWLSFIFTKKINSQLQLSGESIVGISQGKVQTRANSISECKSRCLKSFCVAFTYCDCPQKLQNCLLYADDKIHRLQQDSSSFTLFLPSKTLIPEDLSEQC